MRVVELFAGAGGAAMGLHAAGWQTLARVEWDESACTTLRAAADGGFLDAATVIEGDVRTVDWSPYVGVVDALWASPPCQAWSAAGKRLGASDERNGWPWTWDVCDAVRPTWLLAENVTGLLMHRGDCDGSGEPEACPACYWFRRILHEAERRFASVQWAVLNSSAFGVPQHRRRVYLVCGPRPIAWPKPTHGDPTEIRQCGLFAPALLPWRTVREALNLDGRIMRESGGGGLSVMVGIATARKPGEATADRRRTDISDRPARTVSPVAAGGAAGGAMGIAIRPFDPKHPPTVPDSPATSIRSGGSGHSAPPMWPRTEMTGAVAAPVDVPAGTVPKLGNQYLHAVDPGVRTGPLDAPSDTLAGGASKAHTNGRSIVSTSKERRSARLRRLTVTECALLMSWPADYPLQGTKTAQYRQVGNGCTPPVIEAIARAATRAQS